MRSSGLPGHGFPFMRRSYSSLRPALHSLSSCSSASTYLSYVRTGLREAVLGVGARQTHPLGITLSDTLLFSPYLQIQLSALQRLHGLRPSHFDFFCRQRSHAFTTRFRFFLSGVSEEPDARWVMLWTGRVGEQITVTHIDLDIEGNGGKPGYNEVGTILVEMGKTLWFNVSQLTG